MSMSLDDALHLFALWPHNESKDDEDSEDPLRVLHEESGEV